MQRRRGQGPSQMRPTPKPTTISASGPSGSVHRRQEADHPGDNTEADSTHRATREPAEAGDANTTTRKPLDLRPAPARFVSSPNVHRTWALNRESEAAPMLPPFIIDQI